VSRLVAEQVPLVAVEDANCIMPVVCVAVPP
jgi:hypothetical protein